MKVYLLLEPANAFAEVRDENGPPSMAFRRIDANGFRHYLFPTLEDAVKILPAMNGGSVVLEADWPVVAQK